MAQTTADRPSDVKTRGEGSAATLRIDDETFEAFSGGDWRPTGEEPRILRWLESWAGTDR